MKLVELLAKELKRWPESDAYMVQDPAREMDVWSCPNQPVWEGSEWGANGDRQFSCVLYNVGLADDYSTAIVTQEQWQAERDRQKGGEWKRHRGGKQPVAGAVRVEFKFRSGVTGECYADNLLWDHQKQDDDVMQYRIISQPQEEEVEMLNVKTIAAMDATDLGEGRTFNSAQDLYAALNITSKAKTDQIDGPIKWRDTVNELDAYIEEFTREREGLINRLAMEGFALLPAMTAVMGVADVDMSDWRNWKEGDLVECVRSRYESLYTEGRLYKVGVVTGKHAAVFDDCGGTSECFIDDGDTDDLKFMLRR